MCCGVSFTTNLLHFTHRRHSPRAFGHVRTWAEISIASDRDSAQEGRGVPLVQSGHRERLSHDAPSNEGGERLRRRFAHPGGKRNIRNARQSFLGNDSKGSWAWSWWSWSWWSSSSCCGFESCRAVSSSPLIFSLVLVDWCMAGWRARYLVLGAASCCGFESRRAGSSKTT